MEKPKMKDWPLEKIMRFHRNLRYDQIADRLNSLGLVTPSWGLKWTGANVQYWYVEKFGMTKPRGEYRFSNRCVEQRREYLDSLVPVWREHFYLKPRDLMKLLNERGYRSIRGQPFNWNIFAHTRKELRKHLTGGITQ